MAGIVDIDLAHDDAIPLEMIEYSTKWVNENKHRITNMVAKKRQELKGKS